MSQSLSLFFRTNLRHLLCFPSLPHQLQATFRNPDEDSASRSSRRCGIQQRAARALYSPPHEDHIHSCLAPRPKTSRSRLVKNALTPSYFFTESRWREHRRGLGLPEEPLPFPPEGRAFGEDEPEISLDQMPTGTVGAVALDSRGCIAAVTSTGGRTNKLVGRIGDTPHMGAGFWAEEWPLKSWWRKVLRKPTLKAVGISGTGDGDVSFFSLFDRLGFSKERICTFLFCSVFHTIQCCCNQLLAV